LAEIRETVSFLTETPEYDSFHEDASTEDDDDEDHETSGGANDSPADEENARTKDGFAIPTNPRRTRGPVVDRLSLLRQASSNSASSANNKLAFQSTSSVDPIAKIGFRPPPFLRRSTTGSSSTSTSSVSSGSSSVRTKTGSAPAAAHGKKGAVNYYTAAREREREKELRMKQRGSSSNINALLSKHAGGSLGSIVGKGQWE
jgi:mediator of replication checkpoint protein 1